MRVGFIGLGDQGAPMATAIKRAGFELFVWVRRPQSLELVSEVDPVVCESIEELAHQSDLIGLCLREDSDIEKVVFADGALLASMQPGSMIANHGTGSPDVCDDWAKRCRQMGVSFLDAPVSGGRVGAQDCTLTTMVGGDAAAAARSRPVFESFSRTVVHLGGPGAGQMVKLLNNTLTAANMKNSEDVLELCGQLGLDGAAVAELVQASSGANFAMEALTKRMTPALADHYTKMIGKDVGHFSSAARLRGVPESPVEESARLGVAGITETVARLHGA